MVRMKHLVMGLIFLIGAQSDAIESFPDGRIQTLSIDECLSMAMERNRSRPASRFAVAAAEAQHRQALSAYWPQLSLKGAYELLDEQRNFVFPSKGFSFPMGGTIDVTIPGMGVLPVGSIEIPGQDVKLQDKDSWYASLEAQWLLWDGGMRKGIREQTAAGVDAARVEVRRTDLQVVDSVTRLYYGAVVATQVRQLGEDTLARMDATLSLTKTLYEEGAGTVKKTDYLDNKVMVETLRAAVAMLEQNESMAQAALAYTMGLNWKDSVKPKDKEIPFEPVWVDMDSLVGDAYVFSPDWNLLKAGIRAAEGALGEARSGRYPKLALTGDLHKWWNDYDAGYATQENKEGWSVAVGLEFPLFTGFRTSNQIKEARAKLDKIESERVLLREGIGLQVREILLGFTASNKRYQATLDAMTTSTENRDLNTRAYQNDLVETEDVIRAQLMEAFMSAQHYKMCYDHAELRSRLNLVIGTEVVRTLTGE